MNSARSEASGNKAPAEVHYSTPSSTAKTISETPRQHNAMDAPETPTAKPARVYPRLDTAVHQEGDAIIDTGSTSPTALRSPPAFLTMSQQLAEGDAYHVQALSVRALQGKDDFESELHSKVPESPATSESPSKPLNWRRLFSGRA